MFCHGRPADPLDRRGPPASALSWKADRPTDLPQIQVVGLPAPNLHKEIEAFKADYEVIVIDGGGRITATARAACAVADFILIPTRPSKPDLVSTTEFLRTVIEEVRAIRAVAEGLLITQMQAGTVVGRMALEGSARSGIQSLIPLSMPRVAYQEAMAAGMSPVLEYASDSKAAQETQALFVEVGGTHKDRKRKFDMGTAREPDTTAPAPAAVDRFVAGGTTVTGRGTLRPGEFCPPAPVAAPVQRSRCPGYQEAGSHP